MRAKRDTPTAINATAHKLARLIYRTLKYGQEYIDIGQQQYEQRYKENALKALQRKARQLGYQASCCRSSLHGSSLGGLKEFFVN